MSALRTLSAAAAGVSIGVLFTVMRRAAQRKEFEAAKGQAQELATMRKATSEQIAQKSNLEQMRGTTAAQLRSGLAERGMSPMLTAGAGDAAMASYITQAAGRSTGRRGMGGY